jgi:hypothetical protein
LGGWKAAGRTAGNRESFPAVKPLILNGFLWTAENRHALHAQHHQPEQHGVRAWQTPRKIAPTDKEPAMAARDHDQNTTALPGLRANRNDPLHDLQLVRDLEAVNARCTREIGALPPGGLPVQPRRKPVLSKPEPAAQATPPAHPAAEKQDQS